MLKAVYPGSFDPIHCGHVDIARRAARLFDHLVVGVYAFPRKHLLFTVEERVALVREALRDLPNVEVMAYEGLTAHFARRVGAEVIVRGLRVLSDFELEYQMALTNRELDGTLESVCLMTRKEYAFLTASIVKEVAMLGGDVSAMVLPHVEAALRAKREAMGEAARGVRIVSLRD